MRWRAKAAARDPFILLADFVTAQAKEAGLDWDTYDADFLLGVVMRWLYDHDAMLTDSGIERR